MTKTNRNLSGNSVPEVKKSIGSKELLLTRRQQQQLNLMQILFTVYWLLNNK